MSAFKCQVCDMDLNSQEQLVQHRTGRKHLNKMKEKRVGLSVAKFECSVAKSKLYGTFVSSGEKVGGSAPPLNPDGYSPLPPPPPPPKLGMFQQGGRVQLGKGPIINKAPVMYKPQLPEIPTIIPGINPVMNAVVNNALGKLPLKRKLYSGRCEVCNLVFNAEGQEQQHLLGKKHAKKMRMMAIEEKAGQLSTPVLKANGFSCQFCDVLLNSLEQLEQHRLGAKHQKKVAASTGKPPLDGQNKGTDGSNTPENDSEVDD